MILPRLLVEQPTTGLPNLQWSTAPRHTPQARVGSRAKNSRLRRSDISGRPAAPQRHTTDVPVRVPGRRSTMVRVALVVALLVAATVVAIIFVK